MPKYVAEYADDDKYEFFHRHIARYFEATDDKAMEVAQDLINTDLALKDFYIAQLSREFIGCACPQPVFDAMNGRLVPVEMLAGVDTWEQLMDKCISITDEKDPS